MASRHGTLHRGVGPAMSSSRTGSRFGKFLGTLNNADILTKYVNKETLARHVPTFSLVKARRCELGY